MKHERKIRRTGLSKPFKRVNGGDGNVRIQLHFKFKWITDDFSYDKRVIQQARLVGDGPRLHTPRGNPSGPGDEVSGRVRAIQLALDTQLSEPTGD